MPPRRLPTAGSRAFTLVELLTVIAIVAVLATLLFSSAGGARRRSQEVACRNNLRQIAIAAEVYQDDTQRRPRSLTRLATRPSWISNPRALVCPSDPALRQAAPKGGTNAPRFWGNIANASQEPSGRIGNPEEGSWEAELRETRETVAFSYLHPMGWRRDAWMRLVQGGNQSGVGACELHGTRVPGEARRPYAQYEGQTLRVQRDGAVVSRHIFRTPSATGTGTGATTVPFPVQADTPISVPADADDYPWEFYADGTPAPLR